VKIKPFEVYYKRYEDWFVKHRYAYESEILALKKIIPKFSLGVEIGVGTGRYALPLGIGVGVEPAKRPAFLALSRGLDVVRGVAEEMPFKESSFELELMVTTLCFLDDIQKSLLEVKRTLKPGGCLLIGYVDKDSKLGKAYQQKKEENPFYKEATFYEPSK
jgi:SAM-dependent methyltransferase